MRRENRVYYYGRLAATKKKLSEENQIIAYKTKAPSAFRKCCGYVSLVSCPPLSFQAEG